jgi:hypothetical protein
MTALELFFVLLALVAGLVALAYGVVLATGDVRLTHRDEQPAWPRYHVRYYTFALLFIAFDMEMAARDRPGGARATARRSRPTASAWRPHGRVWDHRLAERATMLT